MAAIAQIRKRGGLLVVVIAIAMGGFILMDVVNSDSSILLGNQNMIGIVDGVEIDQQNYFTRSQILVEQQQRQSGQNVDEQTNFILRDRAWNELISEILLGEEYEKLGIIVSVEELNDMVQGPNPVREVVQQFTNPQTGQFDRSQLKATLSEIFNSPQRKDELRNWLQFEKFLKDNRAEDKYISIVRNGLHIPTWMAELDYMDKNRTANIKYIKRLYTDIPDSTVEASSSEMNRYLNEYDFRYQQDESRDIEFTSFDIIPSSQDTQLVIDWMKEKATEFFTSNDDSSFVRLHSDFPQPPSYYTLDDLVETIKDTFFVIDSGTVIGPYLEANEYKLAKLEEKKLIPDSVKARQILVGVTQIDQVPLAQNLADSLKGLLDSGLADFADLASKYSSDPATNLIGGDLGNIIRNELFSTVNDFLFHRGVAGEIQVVPGQTGFHVIEIIEAVPATEAVKIAFVIRNIKPSKTTREIIYREASEFAVEHNTPEKFREAIDQHPLLSLQTANDISTSDYNILGLGLSRPIVRWCFENNEGDLSEELFEIGNSQYVIVHLTNAREEGTTDLQDIETEIQINVRKEKKAKQIMAEIKNAGASDLESLASSLGGSVESASFVSFSSEFIPGIGNEPKVVGSIFGMQPGGSWLAIEGNSGVFVIQVESFDEPAAASDLSSYVNQLMSPLQSKVEFEFLDALIKEVEITDNRYRFY